MLKIKKILDKFKLEIENPEYGDTEKEINKPAIHRMGLELTGIIKIDKKYRNVIGWGSKERDYFLSLTTDERDVSIRRVLNEFTPCVILSNSMPQNIIEEILKICNEFKIPLLNMNQHLSSINMTIGFYIVKYLSKSESVHGSLVNVNSKGVMIIGESGIGKSEAVLELIQRGATFISDDTVIIKRIGNEFVGEPAPLTKDFLESRGIGLINIPKIYGLQATKESDQIDLVIELLPAKEINNVDRLGNKINWYEVLNGKIPKIQIPVQNGRTLSALIEAAVNVFVARKSGDRPLETISERNKQNGK